MLRWRGRHGGRAGLLCVLCVLASASLATVVGDAETRRAPSANPAAVELPSAKSADLGEGVQLGSHDEPLSAGCVLPMHTGPESFALCSAERL